MRLKNSGNKNLAGNLSKNLQVSDQAQKPKEVKTMDNETQTEISPNAPKSIKISKGVSGATWIINPVGSQYKDPDTKKVITRTECTLQYAKAGTPQKWSIGLTDLENMEAFLASKEYKDLKNLLPAIATLEPNSF